MQTDFANAKSLAKENGNLRDGPNVSSMARDMDRVAAVVKSLPTTSLETLAFWALVAPAKIPPLFSVCLDESDFWRKCAA